MQEYSEKALGKIWCWLVETMSLTEEELAAIDHQISMTQEIYDGILDKCEVGGPELEDLFYRMLEEYPDFMICRAERDMEQIKEIEYLELSEEE